MALRVSKITRRWTRTSVRYQEQQQDALYCHKIKISKSFSHNINFLVVVLQAWVRRIIFLLMVPLGLAGKRPSTGTQTGPCTPTTLRSRNLMMDLLDSVEVKLYWLLLHYRSASGEPLDVTRSIFLSHFHCFADFEQYGGADFHSQKPGITTFSDGKAVEFWAQTKDGIPSMAFRVSNLMKVSAVRGIGRWPITGHCQTHAFWNSTPSTQCPKQRDEYI